MFTKFQLLGFSKLVIFTERSWDSPKWRPYLDSAFPDNLVWFTIPTVVLGLVNQTTKNGLLFDHTA